MSTPTHILFALLVFLLLCKVGLLDVRWNWRGIPAAMFVMGLAMALDLDHIILFFYHTLSDPNFDEGFLEYGIYGPRGVAHSLIGSIVLMALFALITNKTIRAGDVRAFGLFTITLYGHILLDVLCDDGTDFFWPFRDTIVYGPFPYLTQWELVVILVLGMGCMILWSMLSSEKKQEGHRALE